MLSQNKESKKILSLIDKLALKHSLSPEEYTELVEGHSSDTQKYAGNLACKIRREVYSNDVYIRGLIEVGNICRNDCFYCGIRKSNGSASRYILTDEQILECVRKGYEIGFRTFVLQGGEGSMSKERICSLVKDIKLLHPDSAVTLSLGEFSREDYKAMYDAGADRYLLRHETADKKHYEKLHPKEMLFDNRMRCLRDLKEIGFQTGCGFMVGSPFQTGNVIAKDLKFIEEFSPDMCGIGPFIPAKGTPFESFNRGETDLTIYLLSIIRLIKPNILLPATTALGSVDPGGREKGIAAGANVVMPNLSPQENRKKYSIYDNKLSSNAEAAEWLNLLKENMESIGYRVTTERGDIKI